MANFDKTKKPARKDWPSYYIVYRLREQHTSLRRLSRLKGYAPSAASTAIQIPWPKMERIIAEAIGVTPQTIWPSRYRPDGTPKSKRGERLGEHRQKNISEPRAVNVEKSEAI